MSESVWNDDSWKGKFQEDWNDDDFNSAVQWVLGTLALPQRYEGSISGLLETYGPEDITTEMVEEMFRVSHGD